MKKELEKREETNKEIYGYRYATQHPDIREKIENTNLERYGFKNAMQNPEIRDKAHKAAKKYKDYILPSGEVTLIQGYENLCFDQLLFEEGYSEEEIYNEKSEAFPDIEYPDIWYEGLDGEQHQYNPDFYLPYENKIIEAKSEYLYELNKETIYLKGKACIEAGYEFELRIYDKKGNMTQKIVF